MNQISQARCFCCGQSIPSPHVEECPRCHYPATLQKEEKFLVEHLQALQRCASFGGVGLTVGELIRRYSDRLNVLRKLTASPAPALPGFIIPLAPQIAPAVLPPEKVLAIPPRAASEQSATSAPRPLFSFRSFLADQTINIVASLGAFLVLIGALSFIATTTNLLLSFMIVFGIHALFGGVGFSTYRFRTFRIVAIIYTIIFALLVPLVGFSAYRLIEGHLIALTVPTLVAIAAAYAAIVYCLLAIYQRFKPFGYLGITALAVADLALARTLGLAYWWWPVMLMLLSFPMLLSVPTPAILPTPVILSEAKNLPRRGPRFFASLRMTMPTAIGILREPLRLLMFIFVGGSAIGMLIALAIPLAFGNVLTREARFALLTMSLLLLAWTALFLWVSKRSKEMYVVALLFLACVLSFCFALDFPAIGYALALTLVALLYHGLNRFATSLLQPLGRLGFHLDTISLSLVAAVPLIASPLLLEQLYVRAFITAQGGTLPFFIASQMLFQANWEAVAELIAVGLAVIVTLDITFSRAKAAGNAATGKQNWPWLLLLSGFLLNVAFSLVILMLNIVPVWSFLALTLALVGITVVTRRRFGATWANPLDVLALVEACFTFTMSIWQNVDSIWGLLLFFATLSYSLVLYQRRQRLLFLPLVFTLAALPIIAYNHLVVVLLMGVLLPLVSVAIHRQFTEKEASAQIATLSTPHSLRLSIIWEWPLLCIGLLCGVIASYQDVALSSSVLQSWSGLNILAPVEIAGLALVWYVSAALARARLWLIPAIGFAICALVLPANPFWVLVGIAPAAALLAVGVSRVAGRTWALPLYSVALLGAVMAGYAGYAQGHWQAASWVLLAFAALAYAIGLVEDQPLALWIAAAFATWSVIDAAVLVGDLYRPPIMALLCAGIGITIGRLKTAPFPFISAERRQQLLSYALPFYATALAAAILTGVYGSLSGINRPFYGAVPDALLVFALVAFVVLLFERAPEALVIPAGLAAWAIGLLPVDLTMHLLAYDLLCVIVFAAQFVWRAEPYRLSPKRLHQVFSLAGQASIVLYIIVQGGLSAGASQLAHVGAGSLLILSMLLFWYGRLQPSMATRRYCAYSAGLLLSLVISWELVAFGQTRMELLTLAPASYLLIVAPFLVRDEALPQHHSAAQIASIAGAALLLLPELWLSFNQDNLLPTLLLAGESLVLLVLGITTRVRIFVLGGAALVVVSGLRALFLPTLGLPPSLALTVLGVTLLAIATGLSLARHRLQVAWTRWE